MMRGTWKRVGDTAVPVSPTAKAFLSKIEDGKEFSDSKHGKQFRLFFVLCGIVADNSGETKETVRKRAIYQTGYVNTWTDKQGRLHIEPKSIADMKQDEFDRCFKDCLPVMAEWIGVLPDDLRDEVMLRFNEAVEGDIMKGRS